MTLMNTIREFDELVSKLPFSANRYNFLQEIGSGAYSVVFKVYSEKYKQNFAAKMIPLRFKEETKHINVCEAELEALKRLDHRNVIKIYDSFAFENYLVFILRLCKRETLQNVIDTQSVVQPEIMIFYMKQLLDALEYCHSQGVAHRDIKPINIFLDDEYGIVLADFGFSFIQSTCGITNECCGSFWYRSPELIAIDRKDYDPYKVDVWALGITFFQMVTGKMPWTGVSDFVQLRSAIEKGKYSLPSNIDDQIATAISMMIVTDPNKRKTISEIKKLPIFSGSCKPKLPPLYIKKHNMSKPLSNRSPPLKSISHHPSLLVSKKRVSSLCFI